MLNILVYHTLPQISSDPDDDSVIGLKFSFGVAQVYLQIYGGKFSFTQRYTSPNDIFEYDHCHSTVSSQIEVLQAA